MRLAPVRADQSGVNVVDDQEQLDPDAAYRYGFLRRCAEVGLSAQDITVKSAGDGLISDAQKALLGTYGFLTLAAITGGAGVGYGLQRATAPNYDPKELRDRELIDTYRAYAQDARMRALARKVKPTKKPTFLSY